MFGTFFKHLKRIQAEAQLVGLSPFAVACASTITCFGKVIPCSSTDNGKGDSPLQIYFFGRKFGMFPTIAKWLSGEAPYIYFVMSSR